MANVQVDEALDGCAKMTQHCMEKCDADAQCQVGCARLASAQYWYNFEATDKTITAACQTKCNERQDSVECNKICNMGFRDHFYMMPNPTQPLYCVDNKDDRVNPIKDSDVACADICQGGCKHFEQGTFGLASCMSRCTHNTAQAYFEEILPIFESVSSTCDGETTCRHSLIDAWYPTVEECTQAKVAWPELKTSYCEDYCSAFYDPSTSRENDYAAYCAQSCERSFDRTQRNWTPPECAALCGPEPAHLGNEEATVNGCYVGCSKKLVI